MSSDLQPVMDSSTSPCRGVLEANSSPPVFERADAAGGKLESKKLREMELHEEDAEDWKYRGEGAANIVLAYHGSRPSFIGRVLRIRKVSTKVSKHDSSQTCIKQENRSILSEKEKVLWREWPSLAEATTSAAMAHLYAREIVQPLLGREHVDAGLLVYLTAKFLEVVNEEVVANQPEWRRKDAVMEMTGGVALLIADHSSFHNLPGVVTEVPSTITVEIKPKWGCLPTATTIAEENVVKWHVTRFAMHQHLKLKQGKIKSLSKYSPLELFSGDSKAIHRALLALFETPQNNIRIFIDGVEVFGGPEDGGSTEEAINILEEKLAVISAAPEGQRVPVFQGLVASVLHKSKVLSQLLSVQKLDAYDIEGAILAYHKFLETTEGGEDISVIDSDTLSKTGDDAASTTILARPASDLAGPGNTRVDNLALEAMDEQKPRDKEWIRSLCGDESRQVVRNFLIAATAKDCGLMLTLRPMYNASGTAFPVPGTSVATCPTTGQQYICKIALLDLDIKRLDKMPFYHSLDQKIVDTYKASVKQAKPH